ncbi:hypothetical protein COT72_04320 [archaeon CG10_big_fil_rev_8_21_14_0_10_43_11]|nr:MAG: hypothetical protein COT72_04320 [archaeon CG10_big_fil_rev_8_21_14_0_10_43_11]
MACGAAITVIPQGMYAQAQIKLTRRLTKHIPVLLHKQAIVIVKRIARVLVGCGVIITAMMQATPVQARTRQQLQTKLQPQIRQIKRVRVRVTQMKHGIVKLSQNVRK